ncbi:MULTISPECIES: alpha/beta fold hydrolase [Vitreoscilla]|uniref:Alpha/beta hydrolase n=1 Tax=Vitreoscilla stercoraria TaxID=61 RepID=A0ABY4EC78_VITST|nr:MULTISPECIES: alpha/beta hydrolase [Vitreoscilla]AUZ06117.1 putative alpha/beta hydrolase family protein [Vitreoscilla sp. C1]UOO92520.1 alpha/beta hydrolase [Vitreoscilla stercoraria]
MKTKLYLLCGLLCDATVWQRQVPVLQEYYDVQVFDFLGLDDLTVMAQHVLAQDDAPFVLVAHSMGARVALEVVRMAPERVLKLALLDTGVHGVKEGEAQKRYHLLEQAQTHGMAFLVEHWLMPMLAPKNQQDDSIVEPLRQMVLKSTPEDFGKHVHALLNRPDAEASLKQVSCPVLLGVGAQDTWSTVAQHQAIQALMPQAPLVVFDDGGHMAPLEDAGRVNQALLQWLAVDAVSVQQELKIH